MSEEVSSVFCKNMIEVGNQIGIHVVNFKQESLEIEDKSLGYFKKWWTLYDKNSNLLPPTGQDLDTLRGMFFWASIRLHLHSELASRSPYLDWKDDQLQELGIKLVASYISDQIVKGFVGRATSIWLGTSDNWIYSFEQISKAKDPGNVIKIGDYVQAKLDVFGSAGTLREDRRLSTFGSSENTSVELRCKNPGIDDVEYPLNCLIKVRDIERTSQGIVIWGEILLDENGHPLETRQQLDIVIEGLEQFITKMAEKIQCEKSLVFSDKEARKFLEDNWKDCWPLFVNNRRNLDSMLSWVSGIEIPNHLRSISSYSLSYKEVPSIYNKFGYYGTDYELLEKYVKSKEPVYKNEENSSFVYNRGNNRWTTSLFLPEYPNSFADDIRQICRMAGRYEPGLGNITYDVLGSTWGKNSPTNTRVGYKTLMFRLCYDSMTGAKRRQKIQDEVDWASIPLETELLLEQLRHSYESNIRYKIRKANETNRPFNVPENWEEILGIYFQETLDWLGD